MVKEFVIVCRDTVGWAEKKGVKESGRRNNKDKIIE